MCCLRHTLVQLTNPQPICKAKGGRGGGRRWLYVEEGHFDRTLNKPSQKCQNVKISANLVTLVLVDEAKRICRI